MNAVQAHSTERKQSAWNSEKLATGQPVLRGNVCAAEGRAESVRKSSSQ
jgi:hypothetical protein